MSPNIRNDHGYVEAGGENADTEKFHEDDICFGKYRRIKSTVVYKKEA